jgi:hypothetical protein
MTTLAGLTAISQLSEGSLGWNVCGETQVDSLFADLGHPVPLATVCQAALSHGASAKGETSDGVLVALLSFYGVPASSAGLPLATTIPAALGRSHRAIVLISSDSDGNPKVPQPGVKIIGHWLGVYGDDGGSYQCMNSLGSPPGELRSYPQALLQSCDLCLCVEPDVVVPADQPKPASITGGSSVLFYDSSRKRWFSFWVGADGRVYYRQTAAVAALPGAPLQSCGCPGTKLILGAGVDLAGNIGVSLHGGDDTVWYAMSGDGATWAVGHDAEAKLLP